MRPTESPLAELAAALPDALRIAAHRAPRHPHHLSASLDLRNLLDAAAASEPRLWKGREHLTTSGLRAGAMSLPSFGAALADAAKLLISDAFVEHAAHRAFCGRSTIRTLAPQVIGTSEGVGPMAEVGEWGEYPVHHVTTGEGVTLRLKTFGAILLATRHAILNDDRQAVATALAAFPLNAARIESSSVALALIENGDLADGAPVFDPAFGNDLGSSVEPDAAGLALAMAALRNQETTSGHLAGHELRHVAVAPDLEFLARKEAHVSGLADRLIVTVVPALASGQWFALADPALAPTVVVVQLAGDEGKPPISVTPAKLPAHLEGVGLRARCDVGAAMVGRIGVVRGGL